MAVTGWYEQPRHVIFYNIWKGTTPRSDCLLPTGHRFGKRKAEPFSARGHKKDVAGLQDGKGVGNMSQQMDPMGDAESIS